MAVVAAQVQRFPNLQHHVPEPALVVGFAGDLARHVLFAWTAPPDGAAVVGLDVNRNAAFRKSHRLCQRDPAVDFVTVLVVGRRCLVLEVLGAEALVALLAREHALAFTVRLALEVARRKLVDVIICERYETRMKLARRKNNFVSFPALTANVVYRAAMFVVVLFHAASDFLARRQLLDASLEVADDLGRAATPVEIAVAFRLARVRVRKVLQNLARQQRLIFEITLRVIMVEKVGTIESANKRIDTMIFNVCFRALVCLPGRATFAAFLDRLATEFFVVLGNGGAASRIARFDGCNTNGQDQQANIV